jgi:hypothetical protein
MIIVRFADDFIAGFEHLADARRFLQDLRERFARFATPAPMTSSFPTRRR